MFVKAIEWFYERFLSLVLKSVLVPRALRSVPLDEG
jgi:hypothetical protein